MPVWLKTRTVLRWIVHAVLAVGILAAGFFIAEKITGMRKPPPHKPPVELVHAVDAVRVLKADERVVLTGFGTVRPRNRVEIRPQVSGRIIRIHPKLEVGEIIEAGELLFTIDPSDYRLAETTRLAEIEVLSAEIEQLQTEKHNIERLVEIRQNSKDLAYREFQRLKSLLEEDRVGSISAVENAQRIYLEAFEKVTSLKNQLTMLPVRIKILQLQQATTASRVEIERLNLARCEVQAPFRARVETISVEKDQYVTPDQLVTTLADDSNRDIAVSLDGQDVDRWLRFDANSEAAAAGWFRRVENVTAGIVWVERPDTRYEGIVDRIKMFDAETRTVALIVKIPPDSTVNDANSVPLVAGMFCRVGIAGRMALNVARLPRSALIDGDRVYIVDGGRLSVRQVEVVYETQNTVLIGAGVDQGDVVIVSKLAMTIIGMKLLPRLKHAPTDNRDGGQTGLPDSEDADSDAM